MPRKDTHSEERCDRLEEWVSHFNKTMKPYTRSLRKDLTGQKFGMLTVIGLNGRDKGGRAMWLCKCDCGSEQPVIAEGHNLQVGHTASCGCVRYTEKYGKDIIGVKFGRATALRQYVDERGLAMVECGCDCTEGKIFSALRGCLISGQTTSCGCYHKERMLEFFTTHGLSNDILYGVWADIATRCYNTKRPAYKDYGGRGIIMSDIWIGKTGFQSFYDWAHANGYKKGLTIDRIDNNGIYSPENCRWVSMKIQCNNTRKNLIITYKGRAQTFSLWMDELGLNYGTVYPRIYKLGWSVDEAFEVRKRIRHHKT